MVYDIKSYILINVRSKIRWTYVGTIFFALKSPLTREKYHRIDWKNFWLFGFEMEIGE